MKSEFEVLAGNAAFSRIENDEYLREWSALFEACPWATAGQDPRFLRIRYRTYREAWSPVLVEERCGGRLVGMLALGRGASPEILGGGAEDCEYQAWLAREENGESFMPHALNALRDHGHRRPVRLTYLPSGTPIAWTAEGEWRTRCRVTHHETCFLRLGDLDSVTRFVRRKKSLRSLRNQLARSGDVRFRRIREEDEFERVLNTFVTLFDARRSTLTGRAPFRSDPRKRELLRARMAEDGLQHVTVLELDGSVIAAHIGLSGRSGGEFSLAGIVHDEEYGRFSPGSLLLGELVILLCEEGYSTFDLTPGGGAYKDRWGNEKKEVASLTAFPGRGVALAASAKGFASRILRRGRRMLSRNES